MKAKNFKIGDAVIRVGGTMPGEVVKVVPRSLPGGVAAIVKVRWANGYVGEVQDRQLDLVPDEPEISDDVPEEDADGYRAGDAGDLVLDAERDQARQVRPFVCDEECCAGVPA